MSSTSQETCEDFTQENCDLVDVEVSELVCESWLPVVVGKPVALFYVDAQNELYFHSFAGGMVLSELIEDMESDQLSEKALTAVSAAQSLVLSDPTETFTILTNLTVTDLGLETP